MAEETDLTKLVDMDDVIAQQEGEPVHLLQTKGKGAQRSFCVLPLQRAIIGRNESSAICVDEDGVSRQHALVEHHEGMPHLIDLASTNGTFVNGERIDNAILHSGDRIQIGSVMFEVAVGTLRAQKKGVKEGTDPDLRRHIAMIHEQLQNQTTSSGEMTVQKTILAGSLANIGLPSLLQTLEANRNTGSLIIDLEGNAGQIYLEKGRPIHATLGRTRGQKALFRLVAQTEGQFEFVAPGFEPDQSTIDGQLDAILLTAVTEIDEFTLLRKDLPPDDVALVFTPNHTFIADQVPPDLFEVLAAVCRYRTVGMIIDECNVSDLLVCRFLLALLKREIIAVEGEGEPT